MSVPTTVFNWAGSLVGGLIVGFITGRADARRRHKQDQCQTLLNKTTETIRDICTHTRHYLTEANTADERFAMRTEIQVKLRRLRSDVEDLAEVCGKKDRPHADVLLSFNEAITTEPFGDTVFSPLDPWSERVTGMMQAEADLIKCLRRISRG